MYEVEVPDQAVDGLFHGRVYFGTGAKRELIASFTAPTWRHVEDTARAIRDSHLMTRRVYAFDEHDALTEPG